MSALLTWVVWAGLGLLSWVIVGAFVGYLLGGAIRERNRQVPVPDEDDPTPGTEART